jgi:hypothetical protein
MEERGFTFYGDAEAWLAVHGEKWEKWDGAAPPPGSYTNAMVKQRKADLDARAVIACMNEQGFAAYGAAEAWLARQHRA